MLGRLIRRFPEGLAGLSGGSAASQFPSYYGQYLQSLGGRLDQAREQAARLESLAADLGMTAEAYATRLSASNDPAVTKAGVLAQSLLDDRARLEDAFRALSQAEIWERPLVMALQGQPEVARATLERFQPALPLTPEGFAYAALGLLLGLSLVLAARALLPRRAARQVKKETA